MGKGNSVVAYIELFRNLNVVLHYRKGKVFHERLENQLVTQSAFFPG